MTAPDDRPEELAAALAAGQGLLAAGRVEDAVRHLRRTWRAAPGDGPICYQFGAALLQLGRPKRAAAMLRRAVRSAPQWCAARLGYGEALLRLGEVEAAMAQAQAAVELEPSAPQARRLYGVALCRRRRFDAAAAEFRAWLAAAPQDAAAALSLGRALLLAGDSEAAAAACRRAVGRDPGLVRGHLLLARVALAQGRLGRAQAHLKNAVAARPGAASLRAMLARVLLRRSRLEAALDMAQAALAADRGCDAAAVVIAELYIVDGELAQARAILRQLAQRRPDWPELRALDQQLAAAGSSGRQLAAQPEQELSPRARGRGAAGGGEAARARPDPRERGLAAFSAGPGLAVAAIGAPTLSAHGDFLDQIFLLRALILRQLRLHYSGTRFGFLLEYVRPTIVMIFHYFLFTALKKPMPAKIPVELFIIGSFTIWFAAVHVLRGTGHAKKDAMGIPGVTELHMAVSRMAWEFLSMLSYTVLCILLLKILGFNVPYPNIPDTALYFALAALLGFGFGLVLQACARVFAATETLKKNFLWILYVTSGHYFSISEGRHGLAAYVWWNPLLHLSELQRRALYPGYPTELVALWYPAVVAAGLIILGLMLERCTRHRAHD